MKLKVDPVDTGFAFLFRGQKAEKNCFERKN